MSALLLVLSSLVQPVPASPPPGDEFAQQIGQAQSLLGQGQFVAAEKMLRGLREKHADKPGPHYLLGYALHAQKKYDEAMPCYEKAAGYPQTKPTALYNMACICSLTGRTEDAFAYLDQAIDSGFRNRGQLASDTDFANIRSDKRFQALLPRQLDDDELFAEKPRIIHKFVGEAAGDQFGWTARRVGDWDGDGVTDFVSTAPTAGGGAGSVYVYSSRTGKLLLKKSGKPGEQFGNSATGAGDMNQDGTPDLIVGAPNGSAPGNVYVFSGADGTQLHHFRGSVAGDKFGYEVAELGDIDRDGCPDLLVGAVGADGVQPKSGRAVAYSGRTGKQLFELQGEESGDNFGNAAGCARNTDGSQTLAIGAQNAGAGNRGQVYVYRLKQGQPELAFVIKGDQNSVNLGQMFISFPGDIDRDGFPDVYASDFSDSSATRGGGKVLVCSGRNGRQLLAIEGKVPGEGLGTSPSDAGDVTGDGIGDLVIGAWQNNEGASSGGKVYLHDGRSGRLIRAWTCRQSGDTLGFDACGIGDVDGDGLIDFLLTSAWSNTRGPKTGRVFILAGEPDDRAR